MRIAHLILADSNPKQLERLTNRLQHHKADFFIHVNLNTNITPFLDLENLGQVNFVRPRVKVYNNGYSTVEAILNGFDHILQSHKRYDYINVLSGEDYPLIDVYGIHKFFKENPGKIFIDFRSADKDWKQGAKRIKKYYFGYNPFIGSSILEKIVSLILPSRKIPKSMKGYGGSPWFTISSLHANIISDYLLDFPSVSNFFKYTRGSSEFFFQTLMYNSDYKSDLVNDNLRFIDFSENKFEPKTFTIDDAERLIKSGKLFVSKFNGSIDSKILDYLDEQAAISAKNRPPEDDEE
jgi:Core-2/I-Branching enzyme